MTTTTRSIESDVSHSEREEQRYKDRRIARREKEQKKSLWNRLTSPGDDEASRKEVGYLLENLPYYKTNIHSISKYKTC